jgi:hypothetical protein
VRIDSKRGDSNLSSALGLFVLHACQERAEEASGNGGRVNCHTRPTTGSGNARAQVR